MHSFNVSERKKKYLRSDWFALEPAHPVWFAFRHSEELFMTFLKALTRGVTDDGEHMHCLPSDEAFW